MGPKKSFIGYVYPKDNFLDPHHHCARDLEHFALPSGGTHNFEFSAKLF